MIADADRVDLQRHSAHRARTVGEMATAERAVLHPLPAVPFDPTSVPHRAPLDIGVMREQPRTWRNHRLCGLAGEACRCAAHSSLVISACSPMAGSRLLPFNAVVRAGGTAWAGPS